MSRIEELRAWFRGKPNDVLTAMLLGGAAFIIIMALFAPAEVKAAIAAYIYLP